MVGGLRCFSGGAIVVLGGGNSQGPILPPPVPPPQTIPNQSAVERSLGLPQVLHLVASYQGNLQPDMGVPANELDQNELS